MILCDTGPLVAAFNAADRDHVRCVAFLRENWSRLVVPSLAVTEVCHLLADPRRHGRWISAKSQPLTSGTFWWWRRGICPKASGCSCSRQTDLSRPFRRIRAIAASARRQPGVPCCPDYRLWRRRRLLAMIDWQCVVAWSFQ